MSSPKPATRELRSAAPAELAEASVVRSTSLVVRVVNAGGSPDVYIHGRASLDLLDAAFARAFSAPRPVVFDGETAAEPFYRAMGEQTVARLWRYARPNFASKLDIYTETVIDLAPGLARLAHWLDLPVAIDIGHDITDDRAILFLPDERVIEGLLVQRVEDDADEYTYAVFFDAEGVAFEL